MFFCKLFFFGKPFTNFEWLILINLFLIPCTVHNEWLQLQLTLISVGMILCIIC